MPSSSLLSFHTLIPLTTTLPPPTGFFPPGPWVRTIPRSDTLMSSLPLLQAEVFLEPPSLHRWISFHYRHRIRFLLLIVTYFKYPLTTLCTLAWTTWNFSSLVTIYQSSNHLPLWMSLESDEPQVSWWHLQWIGFCRVKMTQGLLVSQWPHLIKYPRTILEIPLK